MEEKPLPLTQKWLWFCLTCICLIVYLALINYFCSDRKKSRNNNSGNRHSDDGPYYIGSTGYEMGTGNSEGGGDDCGGDSGGGDHCGSDSGGGCDGGGE